MATRGSQRNPSGTCWPKGYSRHEGQKYTYLSHPSGTARYMLTSTTIKRQKRFDWGWENVSRAASLIDVAKRLGE